MKHGYYWIKRGKSPVEIAYMSKTSGWKFFDGSHSKMVKQNVTVLSPVAPFEVTDDRNEELL